MILRQNDVHHCEERERVQETANEPIERSLNCRIQGCCASSSEQPDADCVARYDEISALWILQEHAESEEPAHCDLDWVSASEKLDVCAVSARTIRLASARHREACNAERNSTNEADATVNENGSSEVEMLGKHEQDEVEKSYLEENEIIRNLRNRFCYVCSDALRYHETVVDEVEKWSCRWDALGGNCVEQIHEYDDAEHKDIQKDVLFSERNTIEWKWKVDCWIENFFTFCFL